MGTSLAYRLRVELRRRWRACGALALLVAVLGGLVLALAAGARRTSSAYERFLEEVRPAELLVSPSALPGPATARFLASLADLDGVRAIGLGAGVPALPERGTDTERLADAFSGIGVIASLDGRTGYELNRPLMLEGRMPRQGRAEEVLVSELMSRRFDVHVGDRLDVVLLTSEEAGEGSRTAAPEHGVTIELVVTGVGVSYDEVIPFNDLNEAGSILATRALAALVDPSDWNFEGAFIDVTPGTDLQRLAAEIEGMGDAGADGAGSVFVSDQRAEMAVVSDSIRPLAIALAVSAAALALVALVVVGQALSRSQQEPRSEVDAVRAMGVRPRDRVGFVVARAAAIGTAGAAGAVGLAIAVSPRFPIGVARTAETSPGLDIDVFALATGALVLTLVVAATALPSALLAVRRARVGGPPARSVLPVGPGFLTPAVAQGVRSVLPGRRAAVPARSTLFAVTAAVTAVVAIAAFAGSMTKLIDVPHRYGQGWDRMIDGQFGPAPAGAVVDRLAGHPDVIGLAGGTYGDLLVEGSLVPGFGLDSVKGQVGVTLVEGRQAATDDEIVLGGETLERLGRRVGDEIEVDPGSGPRTMTITGRGVFPRMGQGSFSTTGLGLGAQVVASVIEGFTDEIEGLPSQYLLGGRTYHFVAIDTDGPSGSVDRALADLEREVIGQGGFSFVRREQPPTEIRDLERVQVVPSAMAGLLALVAIASLAHLLLTSVRQRTRELALLRTLGFDRAQLRATIAWHATAVALLALVAGIPAGLLLGRTAWSRFADELHAAAPAETPWPWIALSVPVAVLVANLVAAIPARQAARTRPAIALHEE